MSDPKVVAAYLAFKGEILDQLVGLYDIIRIDVCEHDPFSSFTAMRDHANSHNRLLVYGQLPAMPADHPLAELIPAGLIEGPRKLQSYNTAFRAVHDYYGHIMPGNSFSEVGEAKAWLAHRGMFPRGIARLALINETIAQSSFYFQAKANGAAGQPFATQYANIYPGSDRALAVTVKSAIGV
jgi:hypothetical protein